MSTADPLYDDERSFDRAFDRGLSALREDEGTDEQARALERRLLDALGADALDAPLTTMATRQLSGLWWMLGVAALIGAGLLLGRAHNAPLAALPANGASHAAHVDVAAQDGPAPSLAIAKLALLEPSTPPVVKPQAQPRSTRRSVRRAAAAASPLSNARVSAAAKPPLESELALLRRARAALRRDPVAALSLAQQHARDYPHGVFVQEREVLALEALLKQRRSAEAMERAERFVTEQAGSPYALRIREMLLHKPRGAADSVAPKAQESSP